MVAIIAFGGGGGVGVDGLDASEVGSGVYGGGITGNCSLINRTTLPGKNLARSSLLSCEM